MSEPVSTIGIRCKHAEWTAQAGELEEEFVGDGVASAWVLAADTLVSVERFLVNDVAVAAQFFEYVVATKTVTHLAGNPLMPSPIAAGASIRIEYTGTMKGAHFHDFAGSPDIRGFHAGPFKLKHSWTDRSSDGDSVQQMRPDHFAEYDDVALTWVTRRDPAGTPQAEQSTPQRFLEVAEAYPNDPVTVQWEYSNGNMDEADFGVGENANPFENKKVVLSIATLTARGRYVKTRA